MISAAAFEPFRKFETVGRAIWEIREYDYAETVDRSLQDIVSELTSSEVVAVSTTAQLKRLGEMSEFRGTVYVTKGVDNEEILKYRCHHFNVVHRNVEFCT